MGRSKRAKRKRPATEAKTTKKWCKDKKPAKTTHDAAPEPETEKLSGDPTESSKDGALLETSVSVLCCICLDTLSADDQQDDAEDIEEDVTELQPTFCGHVFHGLCLDRWLRLRPNCPVCRDPVNPDPFLRPARIPGK